MKYADVLVAVFFLLLIIFTFLICMLHNDKQHRSTTKRVSKRTSYTYDNEEEQR